MMERKQEELLTKQVLQSIIIRDGQSVDLYNKPTIWKHFLTTRYVDNSKIKELNFLKCQITDEQTKIIVNENLQSLFYLYFDWNNLTGASIRILALKQWKNLQVLRLNHNKIGNTGCKYLSKMKMNQLAIINLCDTQIGNVGLNHLSKMNTPKLRVICLYSCQFNQSAVQTIQTYNNFTSDCLIQYFIKSVYLKIQNLIMSQKYGTFQSFTFDED